MAFLMQIDAWDPVLASTVVLRAASVDDPTVCHLNGEVWWPSLDKLPTFAMDFFGGEFGRISTPSLSATLSIAHWPNFGRYSFADAQIQFWHGVDGANWSGYTRRFNGRIASSIVDEDGIAALAFGVDDQWRKQPLLSTYAGTGGLEGPAGLTGRVKPLALGSAMGVPGVELDSIRSIIQLSAYGLIESIDVPLERLARQFGSPVADYASFSALSAASVTAGTWVTANSIGCVRMGAPPYGKLCFLMKGDKAGSGGWVRRAGAMIKRLAEVAGNGAKADSANLAALDVARPYDLSLYIDEQTTHEQVSQTIAASVNAVDGVTLTGELIAIPIQINAVGYTFKVDGTGLPAVWSIKELGISAPWWRHAIGARPFWDVHSDSEILKASPYDPKLLTIPQKIALAPTEAERDDRTTRLSLRAAALGISTVALSTARTTWLARLIAASTSWRDQTTEATLEAAAYPAYSTGTYTMTAGAGNGALTALSGNGAGLRDSAFFGAGSFATTGNYVNAAITIDYGAPIAIDRVYIAPAARAETGWGVSYINGALLEASNDGAAWTAITTLSGHADYASKPYDVAGLWRYVRVRTPSSNYVALAEFYAAKAVYAPITTGIYAISTPPSGSNYNEAGLVSNGIGLRDGNYTAAASYVATANYAGAFVSIDFAQSTFIDQIVIAPVNLSAGWGPTYTNGKLLEASNDGTTWTSIVTLSGHLDGLAKAYPVGASWRYVRVSGYIALGDFYATKTPREARDADSLAYDAQLNALDKAISEIDATMANYNAVANLPAAIAPLNLIGGSNISAAYMNYVAGPTVDALKPAEVAATAGADIATNVKNAGTIIAPQKLLNSSMLLHTDGTLSFFDGASWFNIGAVTYADLPFKSLAATDAAANTKLIGIAAGADVTSLVIPRHEEPVGKTFTANHLGVLDAGQIPAAFRVKRFLGSNDVSATATTWTVNAQTGITGATVTVTDGLISIPSPAMIAKNALVSVKSVRASEPDLYTTIQLGRSDAAPPNTGSAGGTSVNDNSFNAINTTTKAVISDVMTVKTGASGIIDFGGVLSINAPAASPAGSFDAIARWQWRIVGGSFADVGGADIASTGPTIITNEGGGFFSVSDTGSINVSSQKTGLTANTNYEVQLLAARTTSTPAKVLSFGGTAVATGS